MIGDVTDVAQRSGVKRVSKLRDFPTLRSRFHTLFAQDTMHDFAGGVLGWFIQRAFLEYNTTPDRCERLNQELEVARRPYLRRCERSS